MDSKPYQLFTILKEITECCQEREVTQAKMNGCTVAEARCLLTIKLDQCRTTADIAEKMCVAKSRVTRIVDGLVKKKLLSRWQDPKDRRICVVKFTEKGVETTEKLMFMTLQLHGEVLENLPEGYRDNVLDFLGTLRETMRSVKTRLENGEFSEVTVNT
jgi:DNA-binding MarR family transcriptional regulator